MAESPTSRVKIRPGRYLIAIIIVLILLTPISFAYPPFLLWIGVALIGVFGVTAVEFQRLKARLKYISLKRSVPGAIGRGVPFEISILIRNNGKQAIEAYIRDEVPLLATPNYELHEVKVAPGDSERISSQITIPDRGRYEMDRIWVELQTGSRLVSLQASFEARDELKVLPEIFSSEKGLQQSQAASIELLDKLKVSRQQGVGTEFDSLSEYREGDDFRRIDWRATQRMQYPVVRRFQIERHRDVLILIDCGRLMGQKCGDGTKLDCAVDAGLMVARVALTGGDRCGIGLFDSNVVGFVPPQTGEQSIRMLSECVYDAKSEFKETNFASMFSTLQFRQQKRSLVIVISDILDTETTVRYRNSLASMAQRHLVLFAALKTPLLKEIVQKESETLKDGYEKAVTFRILKARMEAMQSIQQSGVHILDVEPSQLTTPLINQFIELRQGTLL